MLIKSKQYYIVIKFKLNMGKAKKVRKFAHVKRLLNPKDQRIIQNKKKNEDPMKDTQLTRNVEQISSSLFFNYNESIKPPYQILIDTNFINFSIKKKIDFIDGFMKCLFAKCIPFITDCVMAELEKLGSKYRIALKISKDENINRLTCSHPGTYADDCLVNRVMQHKCFIVATNDANLKKRIRKIPGVPLISVGGHSYVVEKLPDVF